ncbi:MAG: RelA/SpoT domain-containing protein [Halioglobus sp.]
MLESRAISNYETEAVAWVEPCYTPEQVNTAARILVNEPFFSPLYDDALSIVNNWRVSHNYPLNTFQMNLRNASRQLDDDAIVAQRTKRLASIRTKLEIHDSMKLTQMQDIGGCRSVLPSVTKVEKLFRYYTETSQIKHELAKTDNYIAAPKRSGYRGIHLVYRYYSDKKSVYNGMKIEMQLRTRYQHAWATAVETVGTFVRQALKSSVGEETWLRFFALTSSEIALKERRAPVPGTPDDRVQLREQIAYLAKELDVIQRLTSYNRALRAFEGDEIKKAHYYLMELKPKESRIYITPYSKGQLSIASDAYARAEVALSDEGGDAVLVSVESVAALRRAYPNYFADTTVFLDLLRPLIQYGKGAGE